ncbi:MAG TPA: carboxypeptidase regulatory-like domain-containing protein [Gemmatimonadaceae bacterium]
MQVLESLLGRATPRPCQWRSLGSLPFGSVVHVSLIAATSIALGLPRCASAQSGSIRGIVVDAESGSRLSFAIVSATPPSDERFTTDSGVFMFGALPAGPIRLRARRLGFAPQEVTVDVREGQTVTVRITLTHIAITLPVVNAVANQSCGRPGPPNAAADSGLAAIFGQLEQNAERYQLLTHDYPFTANYEVTSAVRRRGGTQASVALEPSSVESGKHWSYSPGEVVTTRINSGVWVNIPTLDVFADRQFLDSHCYWYGGREVVDGDTLLRIDFQVADRIRAPDLNGSMYLDPSTYLIRRSILRLSTLPRSLANGDSSLIVSQFDEVLPGVPLVADVVSTLYLKPGAGGRAEQEVLATEEERRRISVKFDQPAPVDAHVSDVLPVIAPLAARPAPVVRLLGVFDDETGEPIPKAAVTDSITGRTGYTTETGTMSLGFLSAAGGALTLVHAGYRTAFLRVAVTPADTAPITTTLARISSAGPSPDDTALATARVILSVRADSGRAIAGADILVIEGDSAVARAETDSSGRATITLHAVGADYDVVVRKLGFARADYFLAAPTPGEHRIGITLQPVAQQLAAVQTMAVSSERYRRLYVDADSIAASHRLLEDAVDIIAKLRPDMVYGLAGGPSSGMRSFCPPLQHLWVNGEEVFAENVTTEEIAIRRAAGNYATRALLPYIASAIAHIHAEHIAEMHVTDCLDLSVGKDRSDALFITLKPGVDYDSSLGSYVRAMKDTT